MRKTFLKKGVRELWGRKLQYLFLVLILGLGVAAYGSITNMHGYRQASFDEFYEEGRFNDAEVSLRFGLTANRSDFASVLASPGVAPYLQEVEYRLVVRVFLNVTDGGVTRTVRGLVYGYELFDASGAPRDLDVNRPLRFREGGGEFASNLTGSCYLERSFSKVHSVSPGETLVVLSGRTELPLAVLDHVNFPEYIWVVEENSIMPSEATLGVIGVPIATARAIAGDANGTAVSGVAVTLRDPAELEAFRENVTAAFGAAGLPVQVTGKEENTARIYMKSDMEGDKEMLGVAPLVIFAVSAAALFMALRKIVQSHRSQVGVFKALGVPDRSILAYFLVIGLLVALSGTVAGLLISIPLDYFFQSIMDRFMEMAVSDYPVSPWPFVEAGAISIVVCLVCALLPALSAVRMRPLDAIQTREGARYSRVGKAASRFAQWHLLPTVAKVTLRNTVRKPARNLTTVFGVAISLALFLGFAIVFESSIAALDDSEANSAWDYEVLTSSFVPRNASAGFASAAGVESVDAGLLLPTRMTRGGAEVEAVLTSVSPLERSFRIELAEGSAEGGIVIGQYAAEKLGVGVGDALSFEHPVYDPVLGFRMVASNVTVSGIHVSHMSFFAFSELPVIENATGLRGMANLFYVRTAGGAELPALESALLRTPEVSSVTYRADRGNLLEQYLDIFIQTTYVTVAVTVAMAGAIVYTLFKINVEDARRDYATMKTLGASTAKLGYMVYLEAAVVTVPGLVLGAVGGQLLAMWMFSLDETFDMANISADFSWGGFAIGACLILAVVAGVVALMLRYISRINIADVIRERSA